MNVTWIYSDNFTATSFLFNQYGRSQHLRMRARPCKVRDRGRGKQARRQKPHHSQFGGSQLEVIAHRPSYAITQPEVVQKWWGVTSHADLCIELDTFLLSLWFSQWRASKQAPVKPTYLIEMHAGLEMPAWWTNWNTKHNLSHSQTTSI